jgi:hypothetical protein
MDRCSSVWIFGTAIETIVWSMKIMATAKIIAASTSVLLLLPLAAPAVVVVSAVLPGTGRHPDGDPGKLSTAHANEHRVCGRRARRPSAA